MGCCLGRNEINSLITSTALTCAFFCPHTHTGNVRTGAHVHTNIYLPSRKRGNPCTSSLFCDAHHTALHPRRCLLVCNPCKCVFYSRAYKPPSLLAFWALCLGCRFCNHAFFYHGHRYSHPQCLFPCTECTWTCFSHACIWIHPHTPCTLSGACRGGRLFSFWVSWELGHPK